MHRLTILLTCCGALAICLTVRADDDPEPPSQGKELQGAWVFVKVIGKGPGGPDGDLELTFTKDKLTVVVGKRERLAHTFTIDPKKKPAHIDVTDANRGKKIEGIYKIEKGELYLCIGEQTGKRPTAFDGKDESVIVLKRQKK